MSVELKRRTAANSLALSRMMGVDPVLTGLELAATALGLGEGELGHAGPPFESMDEIPLPVLRALAGAAMHEGWAGSVSQAARLIREGEIRLRSNHDLGTVSPMAGVVRPRQMVMRVEDRAGAGVTYATLAEAGRQVLRFGVYNDGVAEALRWLDGDFAAALRRALPADGLPVIPLIAAGVAQGDDVHQRNLGGMAAFIRALPELDNAARHWLFGNPQHFLNYAMAAAKLVLDGAANTPGSTIVTAISRNGAVCGVRLAGTGSRWFSAPATIPEGGFFPPFTKQDAQPDLGDSAIMEAFGLGGAISHGAPELARDMSRGWDEAMAAGAAMRRLFVGAHSNISSYLLGEAGAGYGLDAAKIVALNQSVRIHTGIAHKDGETGWIGVGVAHAPVDCFALALADFADFE